MHIDTSFDLAMKQKGPQTSAASNIAPGAGATGVAGVSEAGAATAWRHFMGLAWLAMPHSKQSGDMPEMSPSAAPVSSAMVQGATTARMDPDVKFCS